MSANAVRVWGPSVLGAVSVVVVGYALNRLTGDHAEWWWWIIVGVGSVLGIVGTVWTGVSVVRERRRYRDGSGFGPIEGGGAAEQTASGDGANISITADRGSAAALEMGNVSIGNPRRRGRSERNKS